ncbi:MAG: hypothetical protein ABJB98_09365, partial [Actinomycetota bacterium]
AARRVASLHVPDQAPQHDALIAGTALARGLTVVTRNTRDFERTGVEYLNPWSERRFPEAGGRVGPGLSDGPLPDVLAHRERRPAEQPSSQSLHGVAGECQ